MFVWSSQQSLPTQTQNLMEKNAIHSHKYSSVQILFIKTSSFFKANWSHWRCWCFFQAHSPCRGLEIDEFPYLKRWPVKLEIYIADLECRGTVFRCLSCHGPSYAIVQHITRPTFDSKWCSMSVFSRVNSVWERMKCILPSHSEMTSDIRHAMIIIQTQSRALSFAR